MFCLAKGPEQGNVLRIMPLLERFRECFILWGVETRASDKHQCRGKLVLSSKLVFSGAQDWLWLSSCFLEWRILHQVVLPFVGVLDLQKDSKILLCIFLKVKKDHAPRQHYCLFTASPWFLHPLPSLISNFPLEVNWELLPKNKKWRTWKTCMTWRPIGH